MSSSDEASTRRAPRSRTSKAREDRLARIARLKNSKGRAAGARDDDDDDVDKGRIYDEVDEQTYQTIVKKRLQQADFVVDDDGRGYVDNGLDEFGDDDDDYSSEASADGPAPVGKGKAGAKKGAVSDDKRKRKPDDRDKVDARPSKRINELFKGAPTSRVADDASTGGAAADVNDDSFMDALLSEIAADTGIAAPSVAPVAAAAAPARGAGPLSAPSLAAPVAAPPPVAKWDMPAPVATSSSSSSAAAAAASSARPGAGVPAAAAAPAASAPVTTSTALPTRTTSYASSAPYVPPVLAAPAPATPALARLPDPPLSSSPTTGSSPASEPIAVTAANAIGEGGPISADGKLRMFWTDAHEQQGVVYLMGKTYFEANKAFISCCVSVRNIQRNVFVLPREKKLSDAGKPTDEDVQFVEVYEEVSSVMDAARIPKWASKSVVRKYAFEMPGVPAEATYLKVVYPYSAPALPMGLSGRTFSAAFGTNTSMLELFLRKRNIMGPCWLEISNCALSDPKISWCKLEVQIQDPKDVACVTDNTPAPPPLVAMSISIKTILNEDTRANEVIAVAATVHAAVNMDGPTADPARHYTTLSLIRSPANVLLPTNLVEAAAQQGVRVEVCKGERLMLSMLINHLFKVDPDIIVGHNFVGFHLDVLLHRMRAQNVEHCWPKMQAGPGGQGESTYAEKAIVSGRLLCDTYLSARELVRQENYTLGNLVTTLLGVEYNPLDYDNVPAYFGTVNQIVYLVKHCETDSRLAFDLLFKLNVLPLTKQLTNLAGNLWSHTLLGARAERNEYLLLHEFHKKKYICPDKAPFKKQAPPVADDDDDERAAPGATSKGKAGGKRKPAYTGGLVLEPKRGFYDKFILLLDFNSLYPSIIQEYNICFTTVQRTPSGATTAGGANADGGAGADDDDAEVPMPEYPDSSIEQGVLPRILRTLVQRRRQVKALMKAPNLEPGEYAQLDIRQQALKLTANSMYGCLGFAHSRFYAKALAMMITSKGREILQKTVTIAEQKCNLEVIYGDTDSIMINTGSDDLSHVKSLGRLVKKEVNQLFKLLEIDIDGIFQKMLLLKKKKYAAVTVTEAADGTIKYTRQIKGLDLVRRDWCGLTKTVSNAVLDEILSGKGQEEVVEAIHDYLTRIAKDLRDGVIPLSQFVINKSLTKNPEEYPDAKNQPHVQVALRRKAKGMSARPGDTVPYVICTSDDPGVSYAMRAHHPDDVARPGSGLTLDLEWYLKQQVHPPVARLCEPIEGTDAAQIATCLGLDPAKFSHGGAGSDAHPGGERVKTLTSQMTDEQRFADAVPLKLLCTACATRSAVNGLFHKGSDHSVVLVCPNPSCKLPMLGYSVAAQVNTAIRDDLQRYYDGWVVCDEPSCRNRTRQLSMYGRRCLVAGCRGIMHPEYSDTALYTQLSFYEYIFNSEHHLKKLADADSSADVIKRAREALQPYEADLARVRAIPVRYLERNARRFVDLGALFQFVKS